MVELVKRLLDSLRRGQLTERHQSRLSISRCSIATYAPSIKEAEERAASVQNRIADQITAFAGSMWFVYIHVVWFGLWIGLGAESTPTASSR